MSDADLIAPVATEAPEAPKEDMSDVPVAEIAPIAPEASEPAAEVPAAVEPVAEPEAKSEPAGDVEMSDAAATESAPAADGDVPASAIASTDDTPVDSELKTETDGAAAGDSELLPPAVPAPPFSTGAKRPRADLASLNTRQYLDQTVVPILLKGLSQVAKERPSDPIQALADYLVSNKDTFKPLSDL